jgi:hypothetical protein
VKAIVFSTKAGAFDPLSHKLPNTRTHLEPDKLTIQKEDSYIFVRWGAAVARENFPDDDPHVLQSRRRFNSPEYFIVCWRGEKLFIDFILSLQNKVGNCLVDGDIGEIQEFEDFVDDSGVRGAPDFIIQDLRGMIRNDPKMRREFEVMSKLIERTGQAHRLSREARIMLFGKK